MTDTKPFPSYKHSGQKYTTTFINLPSNPWGVSHGCCKSCTPYQCTCSFVASFDLNGNVLVPSGNIIQDPDLIYNWANTSPPGEIHPIPSAYQVTINGINNLNINESWCQNCTDLNDTYYMRLPRQELYFPFLFSMAGPVNNANYWVSSSSYDPFGWNGIENRCITLYHIQLLGVVSFCNVQKPISFCGFTELKIYLMIGQEGDFNNWWESYNEAEIAPYSVNSSYVYRNKNRENENRPQLKIFAVAHFTKPRWGTQVQDGPWWNPGQYDIDGYVFKTIVGDFNGDYLYFKNTNLDGVKGIHSFDTIISEWVLYGNPNSCSAKAYHGDFDGRNLSFTIRGTDRVVITSEPDKFNMICYMDGMTIDVIPLEDTLFCEKIVEPGIEIGCFKVADKVSETHATVFEVSNFVSKQGIQKGDVIFFTKNADYEMEIFGVSLYKMHLRNIIGVERDGELKTFGKKLLVKNTTKLNDVGMLKRIYASSSLQTGVVVEQGTTSIEKGKLITFFGGIDSKVKWKGQDYSFVREDNIKYIM